MIQVKDTDIETLLFLAGGCVFFGGEPLFRAYALGDAAPGKFGPPARAAIASLQIGAILMIVPTAVFRYAQAARGNRGNMERRRSAPAIALLLGLATATGTGLLTWGNPLLFIVASSVVGLLLSRVIWTKGGDMGRITTG